MSIKTELKQKLQEAQKRQKELEREEKAAAQIKEAEARKFLTEVVIPKFRKMADDNPTGVFHSIEFFSSDRKWYYDVEELPKIRTGCTPYSFDTVEMAVKLAKEFDIAAVSYLEMLGEQTARFYLDLR